MRARLFAVCVACAVFTVAVGAQVGSAQTTRTLTVIPNTDLTTGDIVDVSGSGFAPSVDVGICQAVVDGTPDVGDCGELAVALLRADESGGISAQFVVRRFLIIRGQQVDCAAPGAACVLGAAELSDVANTSVVVPLSFLPATGTPQPDLIHKRRDTQQLFYDNQYFPNVGVAPQRSHTMIPGGNWVFALIVQNDGDITDDLVLSAPVVPSPPFTVHFYFSWADVTPAVTGSGFTFHDVAPGQSFVFAMDFHAEVSAAEGSGVLGVVKLSSASAPELADFERMVVGIPLTPA